MLFPSGILSITQKNFLDSEMTNVYVFTRIPIKFVIVRARGQGSIFIIINFELAVNL